MTSVQDALDLARELSLARADVARFQACCNRPWNPEQRSKCVRQLQAARRHLARLGRLEGTA